MPVHTDLHQHYVEACQNLGQPENPLIAHVLQEADTNDKINWTKGITVKIAGKNHLVPVQRVRDDDLQVLASVLCNTVLITGLDLRCNALTDAGAKHVATILQENYTLKHLNLMLNDIGTSGAELIARALHSLNSELISTQMHKPPNSQVMQQVVQHWLCKQEFVQSYLCIPLAGFAEQSNKTLVYLRMTGNKIGNKGGMFFASMLQINSTLEKLDLGDCDVGTQCLIATAIALNHNKSVKAINLNRPLLYSQEEETTVHIALMLKNKSPLVELHLCKHEMKNFGVERLCEALYENSSLRYLNLGCNKITRDGAKFLGELLKRNQTLAILDLQANRIEDDGAIYLSEALASSNRTLQALSVVSNNITGKGLVALSGAMKINTALSYIYIWGNKFDEATCTAFSELIHSGRLSPDCTDVEPYEVDGHFHLAELSHGLQKHYYWMPSMGGDNKGANASLAIAAVSEYM